jgi:hypothetical protein
MGRKRRWPGEEANVMVKGRLPQAGYFGAIKAERCNSRTKKEIRQKEGPELQIFEAIKASRPISSTFS